MELMSKRHPINSEFVVVAVDLVAVTEAVPVPEKKFDRLMQL